jgi:cysteine desulfurase family protein (TIGR01976 family)
MTTLLNALPQTNLNPNLDLAWVRSQFPALSRTINAQPAAFLDGPGGTQVTQSVIDAISRYLKTSNANTHGQYATSHETDEVIDGARSAMADFLGCDSTEVVFGPNMTTLTFHFAETLSASWKQDDEVVVTSLDHDANVRPWLLAAQRAGARVRWAQFDPDSGELLPEAFDQLLSERTRLVAVTAASNAIGTKPDVRAISERAHAAGALTYVDGVHATPHGPVDVAALGADFYACSIYKVFGPHIGTVVASPTLLERLTPTKLAPAPEAVPERFERGTPAFELLAGVTAAVDWLADLTDADGNRRQRILAALQAVEEHLQERLCQALEGLAETEGVRILGAPRRRTPTISFLVEGRSPKEVAQRLAKQGISVWDGDNYAFELMRRFGLAESGGAVRASIVLYNDARDVDRFLEAVADIALS